MALSIAPVPHVLANLPEGVDAIRATLRHMVKFARVYGKDIQIRELAENIVRASGVPEKDYAGEIRAVQNWVRDRIRYMRDPAGAEMVQTPKRTVERAMGDCDDKSTLLASLLSTIGVSTRFAAVGFDGGPYSHVLTEGKIGSRWVPLETIVPNADPGWYPPGVTRRMVAHV